MAIKTNISKDQQKELRAALAKMKVPEKHIHELLSSQNGPNTFKAFRQGKKVTTKDGSWVIHFGGKWAKPAEEKPRPKSTPAPARTPVEVQISVPAIDEESLPDAPPIEIVMPALGADKPKPALSKDQGGNQIMVSFQLEREYMMEMQKLASKQGMNVNQLFRLAIKRFLGK